MKKILGLLWKISLIGTSTTSLVACNTSPQYAQKQLKELKYKNNININGNILEWIAPQENPFNTVDNRYYFVVWKNRDNWNVTKFKNNDEVEEHTLKLLEKKEEYKLMLHRYSMNYKVDLNNYEPYKLTYWPWRRDNRNYFKTVYRWNLDIQEPNLTVDKDGNVKVKEI